jgi:hypothetical protein
VARLFNECEWTQEKIARKMGKSHAWVSFRLTFGRFLSFTTTGCKTEQLTERAFRKLYSGTRGTEQERFAHVAAKLQDTPLLRTIRARNRFGAGGRLRGVVCLPRRVRGVKFGLAPVVIAVERSGTPRDCATLPKRREHWPMPSASTARHQLPSM